MAYSPNYAPESPYAFTQIIGRFLAYYVHRQVPPHHLDVIIVLENERYTHRPDLLATDLYGDPDLFWVFAIRNGLQDPVFDLEFGVPLVIPHPSFVRTLV